MLSDVADTYELSDEDKNYLSFINRAVCSVESSNIDHPNVTTLIPEMLIETSARHLWDVKTLRMRGKTIVSHDVSTVLRNARYTMFMTDRQYEKLEPYKRAYVEAVVTEMLKDVGQLTSVHSFVTDPSLIIVGYKAISSDAHVRWFNTESEVFAFGQMLSEHSLEDWEVGTVFADGYVNFDGCPKSSGFSTVDFTGVSTANVFRKRKFTRQWDYDSELPFAEPAQKQEYTLQ